MCISNTPDTLVQEHEAHHYCHDEKGLGRTVLHLFDPSKSDTHDKPTSSNSVVNQQQQRKQQLDQSSSSSPTIAEPASEVSSISSTTKPQRTIPAFILRKQAKMHVPTMIVVRMNDAAQQQLDLGMATNDAHLSDENDATTPAAATRTTTTISGAISTFSSWVHPNSETLSSNDDATSTSSSSNAVLSTFSSWVRTDSPK